MNERNIYKEYGFDSREEYLKDLADNEGVARDVVFALADMLGESEDFDGLVTSIEDFGYML